MEELLQQLADVNYSDAPFLIAYGITWNICGWMWLRFDSRTASLATLFQGMFALPLALGIMFSIGAFENRPDTGIVNELVIIIAMSQLLVIPLLIAIFIRADYPLIPFVFSAAGAVHFLMYTWLYQTFSYIVMAVLIAMALAIVYGIKRGGGGPSSAEASSACFATGILLLLHAVYLVISHVI